jgi:hypothetical protein
MIDQYRRNDFYILEVLARANAALRPCEICERVKYLPSELAAEKLAKSSFYNSLKRLMPKYVRRIPQNTFPRRVKYAITKAGHELLKTLESNLLLQFKPPESLEEHFIISYANHMREKLMLFLLGSRSVYNVSWLKCSPQKKKDKKRLVNSSVSV